TGDWNAVVLLIRSPVADRRAGKNGQLHPTLRRKPDKGEFPSVVALAPPSWANAAVQQRNALSQRDAFRDGALHPPAKRHFVRPEALAFLDSIDRRLRPACPVHHWGDMPAARW